MGGIELAKGVMKVVETIAKEGVKKGVEDLKDGKSFSESLYGGIDRMKEFAFRELDKFLSSENYEKLTESSKKLNNIQEKLEFEPQEFIENHAGTVNDVNDITESINEIAKDLKERLKGQESADEITKAINEFKDILCQMKEVQVKLGELGVSSDSLSKLNMGVSGKEKMDEVSYDATRPYRRAEIDKSFTKVKAQMHQEALIRGGDGVALYKDCYTGETLRGGAPYDYEHIRSSEAVFMTYRDRLTNSEIAEVVNCPENVAVTLRTINQSKGKMKMEDWLANAGNISNHNINEALTFKALANADKGIERKVAEILSRKL